MQGHTDALKEMENLFSSLLGKKLSPEEQAKKWRSALRSQERELDKQVRGIDSEEIKTKRLIKQAAKRGDKSSCFLLSKEIIRARKAKDRIITSKATLNSLVLSIQQQIATAKVASTLGASAEIMKLVNSLTKIPETAQVMQELQKEMIKSGIIEEMLEDTLAFSEPEDLEDLAQEEVDKVLYELTDGLFGDTQVPSKLPILKTDKEQEDMSKRLKALNS